MQVSVAIGSLLMCKFLCSATSILIYDIIITFGRYPRWLPLAAILEIGKIYDFSYTSRLVLCNMSISNTFTIVK